MPTPLTSARRSELRGEAHKLRPVVMISDKKGLSDDVLAEVDRALTAHELVKVKAASDDREARAAWLARICDKLSAHPVQQIGKVLVVYRENPEARKPEPVVEKPAKKAAKKPLRKKPPKRTPEEAAKLARRPKFKVPAEAVIGTSRRRSRTPSPRPESEPRQRRPNTSRSGLSRSVKSRKFSRA